MFLTRRYRYVISFFVTHTYCMCRYVFMQCVFFLPRSLCGVTMGVWTVRFLWAWSKYYYPTLTLAPCVLVGINFFQLRQCASPQYSHLPRVPWCPLTRTSDVKHHPHLSIVYPHLTAVGKLTCINIPLSVTWAPRNRHVDNPVSVGLELK
jgi:hypothetical protein